MSTITSSPLFPTSCCLTSLTNFYLLEIVVELWIPQGNDGIVDKHCISQLQNNWEHQRWLRKVVWQCRTNTIGTKKKILLSFHECLFNYGFASQTSFMSFIIFESFMDRLVVLLVKPYLEVMWIECSFVNLDSKVLWTWCLAYEIEFESFMDLVFDLQNWIP